MEIWFDLRFFIFCHNVGVKRVFGIFSATRRQGFIGGLLSSGSWILPVTGIGFAGLFREEIAEMRNDITSKKIS